MKNPSHYHLNSLYYKKKKKKLFSPSHSLSRSLTLSEQPPSRPLANASLHLILHPQTHTYGTIAA